MFDVIVVGKGLMGVAAWRHLSEATRNVAIVGPDEPANYATHDGVFASHYDEGRAVCRVGKDRTWATLTTLAIDEFRGIEDRSGIAFYRPCGRLTVAREQQLRGTLSHYQPVAEELKLVCETIGELELAQNYSMFSFPEGFAGVFEPAPAGLLRPRALIRAQLAIGTWNGASVIREEVRALRLHTDHVTVITARGQRYRAERVLVAAGAFANCHDLLQRKLAVRVKSEITVLAEVPGCEVARFDEMPTLAYAIESPFIDGIYVTPPLQYSDGRHYIKVGCNTTTDEHFGNIAAMQTWMREGPWGEAPAVVAQALQMFMPRLELRRWVSHPCLVAYTPHGKPFIDQIGRRVFVAAGGNGASAQCSCMLGALAADLLLDKPWPAPFARHEFRAIFTARGQPGSTADDRWR